MFNFPETENKILKFWQEQDIFNKLRKKNQDGKRWSFLDGPITANNPMGVHHAWGRTYKDLFQRQRALMGFDQRYQNGFDCQGLWVEVEVEKELGFKTKKDIETYGIDKFVEKCKERVRKYSAIQTEQSKRLGQWMDWENSYFTMSDENNYTIWGFLKKCHEKGYLYKGKDSVPWCPRCGTAISQHEILTEEYKELTHKAIYFKLPIKSIGASFLVWTTTPWTLPGNVALVVNPEFEYGLFRKDKEGLILLKDLAGKILGEGFKLEKTFKGKELEGLEYETIFDNLEGVKSAGKMHFVVSDKDFVIAEEGTGIVHMATGAGTEDFRLGKAKGLPIVDLIDESAVYIDDLGEFSHKNAKTNPEIILDYIKGNDRFFFKIEDYTHRYPTCWRCKTELVWRAVDEWYISMDKLRSPLMDIAKGISWIPSFGKERELDWLKNMEDWLISKKRYWGLALPIFECTCGNFEVIGSKEELKKRAIEGWDKFEGNSPHRPWVDKVKIKCSKCGNTASRIADVGNPWLDAGIVPFSTMKYNSDHNYWKKWFPAELVCESFPGQFKNWFYSILVMSTVLEKKSPVKTIFGFASVKDEKGEEMHKSKGNAIWFDEAVEKVGADPMRWMYAKQNPADNLKFGYGALDEVKRKLLTLYNTFTFFSTYVERKDYPGEAKLSLSNVLDKWIVSKLNSLIDKADGCFKEYDVATFINSAEDFFINDLSLWYLRRSRQRFHEEGREEVVKTFYYVLLNFLKLISPVMPFFAEELYLQLRTEDMPESIHLTDWPKADKKRINKELEMKMDKARTIVNLALAKRVALTIKVRQPLLELKVKGETLDENLLELIKEEVNVKRISFNKDLTEEVELNTQLTDELREEGRDREIVRNIKDLRKILKTAPSDKVLVYSTLKISDSADILKEVNALSYEVITEEDLKAKSEVSKEILIEKVKYLLGIKKNGPTL